MEHASHFQAETKQNIFMSNMCQSIFLLMKIANFSEKTHEYKSTSKRMSALKKTDKTINSFLSFSLLT